MQTILAVLLILLVIWLLVSYRVSITDACGQVQARDVVLLTGPTHTNDIKGVANNSMSCDSTDYYLQPQIGAYFPHTYYAYPNGDLNQTPYTITFTSPNQMVTVQGANGMKAFEWTLPTPTPYVGGKYAFKYTDICNTDVNSPNVRATTMTVGNRRITASTANCSNNMDVWVGNGWLLPVTITATPTNGGTPLVQQITNADTRTTTFTNLPAGTTYEVTFQDNCASHVMADGSLLKETFTVNTNKTYTLYKRCGGNIDGLSGIDMTFGSGWQKNTITATFNSGPVTYHSTLFNQDYSVTYPKTYQIDPDGILRVNNLAPGTYNITLTDGCYSTPYTFTVNQSSGTTYNFPNVFVAGCPGAQTISSSATSTCNGISADIYNAATNSTIGNGYSGTFTLNNVPPGNYIVYYYAAMMKNALFISPNIYQNNNTSILLKSVPVTVPVLDSYPSLGSYGIAQCDGTTGGGINVQLYKSSNSANISTFSIERTAGQGDFYTPQTSNIFTLADYGSHAYRLTDECGNTSTGNIDVQPNINPVISVSSNICLAMGDVVLSVSEQQNTTYVWSKPDDGQINIYDMNGRLILTKVVNGKAIIDITRLAKGAYVLRTKNSSAKFIKN